jgi:hypothetical protein
MARIERESNLDGRKADLKKQINVDYDEIELFLDGLMNDESMKLPEQAALFRKIREGLTSEDGILDITKVLGERNGFQAKVDTLQQQVADLEAQLKDARTSSSKKDADTTPIALSASSDENVDLPASTTTFAVDADEEKLIRLLRAANNGAWLKLLTDLLSVKDAKQKGRTKLFLQRVLDGKTTLIGEGELTQEHQDEINRAEGFKTKLTTAEGDKRDLERELQAAENEARTAKKILEDEQNKDLTGSLAYDLHLAHQAVASMQDPNLDGSLANQLAKTKKTLADERDENISGSLAERLKAEKADADKYYNGFYNLSDGFKTNLNEIRNVLPNFGSGNAQRLIMNMEEKLPKRPAV